MTTKIPYLQQKNHLMYMLEHHQNNCLNYLDLDRMVDDIQTLYDFDQKYVAHYREKIQMLECVTWN